MRTDLLDESDWGERLRNLMNAIAIMVEAEMSRFPDNVGHVLGSRRLRSYQSLAGSKLLGLYLSGRSPCMVDLMSPDPSQPA